MAAEHGYLPAAFTLGRLYATGETLSKDPKRALAWYTRAAQAGSTDAQINLGYLYAEGDGVAQDLEAAYAWFYTAQQLDHPLAADNLAVLTAQLDADGVTAGQKLALEFLEGVQAKLSGGKQQLP